MIIDDKIAEICVNNLPILEHIHPNYITGFGLLLNIIIAYKLFNFTYDYILIICLALRFFTDILDGAMARKYNKVTYVGGLLDTTADSTLILIVFYYFIKLHGLPSHLMLIPFSILLSIFVSTESYSDHSNLKVYGENYTKDVIAFLINNTVIVYGVVIGYFLVQMNKNVYI